MEKQFRNFQIQARNNENEEKSYIVEGYATTFNQTYNMGENEKIRLLEQVDSKAFDNTKMDDVIFQYDHEGRVFARQSNGTLELSKDEHGLKIKADLSGTENGRSLYEDIKGGYINKMSFAFNILDYTEEKRKGEDGKTEYVSTITKIGRVFDVSAVSIPANDTTEINARKFEEKEKELREAEQKETDEKLLKEKKEKKDKDRQRLSMELELTI